MKITVVSPALAASLGVAPGATIEVEERKGVPKSREWRNRLRDAAIDGCVRIAQNTETSRAKTKRTTED